MSGESPSGELNLAWARQLLEELSSRGVDEVQIAPGSRSAPLVLAAHACKGLNARVHLDERSAGFFALGYGRRKGRPSGVITTSGTAVANLLPAVVEASASDVPLLLITADRPPRLRGRDANQTVAQPGIFGVFVRKDFDVALPSTAALQSRLAERVAGEAFTAALGPPAGPVHLNVPFDKPLHPQAPDDVHGPVGGRAGNGAPEEGPLPQERSVGRNVSEVADQLSRLLAQAQRPIVVAGPSGAPDIDGPALIGLAGRLGVPVLADPLSGARFHESGGKEVIGGYTHFLQLPEVTRTLQPDLILRTGRTPTSAALEAALAEWSSARQVVVDAGSLEKDHQGLAELYLRASPGTAFGSVVGPPAPTEWLAGWRRAEDVTWEAIQVGRELEGHEGAVVGAALEATPSGSTFFVSSSMPVRDLDGYGRPGAATVRALGNRGASGIDGIVSSVLGCAAAGAEPVVGVLGDLAFLHDLNGLGAARDRQLRAVLVVIDNDGGGIFHMLPIRAFEPAFTPYFATPHGLDLRHAAALFDIPFHQVRTAEEVGSAVAEAAGTEGVRIIHIRTDREINRTCHQKTTALVRERLQSIL